MSVTPVCSENTSRMLLCFGVVALTHSSKIADALQETRTKQRGAILFSWFFDSEISAGASRVVSVGKCSRGGAKNPSARGIRVARPTTDSGGLNDTLLFKRPSSLGRRASGTLSV